MLKKIKRILFNNKNEYEIPQVLASKFNKYLALSVITLFIGMFACFLLYDGSKIFIALLFPFAIAVGLLLNGLYFRYKITSLGYNEYEGICVDHKYSNIGTKLIDADFSFRKQVTGLLVECADEIINVPVPKLNEIAPIGSRVKVYIPKDAVSRKNHNGVTVFSDIFGYELLPSDDIEEEITT